MEIEQLFTVKSGDFHATSELDAGGTPLISCGDTNNGLVGYFDIPEGKTYCHCLTVAYNGSWPLLAKFHPYRFGAKDDVAVLVPRTQLRDVTLFYVAALLNRMTWRYSYGRKCFKEKLSHIRLSVSVTTVGDEEQIDEEAIAQLFGREFCSFIPEKAASGGCVAGPNGWRAVPIVEILEIERGDFHSIAALDPGEFMTISRTSDNNGVVGYFTAPEGARVHPPGRITVSTVSGDAFVQLDKFIATDNVIICKPRRPLPQAALFFLAFMLNRQKWRYSYGRQCYKTKFGSIEIVLPVTETGEIDEAHMSTLVENTSYWPIIRGAVATNR